MADTGLQVQVKPQGRKRGRPRVYPAGSKPTSSRCVVYIGKSMELWQQLKLDGNFKNDSEFASYLLQLYQTSSSNKPHEAKNMLAMVSKAKDSTAILRNQATGKGGENVEIAQHKNLASRAKQAQSWTADPSMMFDVEQDAAVDLRKTEANRVVDSSEFGVGNLSSEEGNALENAMIRVLQQQSNSCKVQICNDAEQDRELGTVDDRQLLSCPGDGTVGSVQSDWLGNGLNILSKKTLYEDELQHQPGSEAEKAEKSHVNEEVEEHDLCESGSESKCQETTLDVSSARVREEDERVENEEDEIDLEEEAPYKNSDTSIDWITQTKSVKGKRSNDQICSICGLDFPSMYRMGKHMKTAHGVSKPFACDLCKNVSFSSKGNLDSHTFHKHTAERKYTCDVCNAAFKLPRHLQRHMIVHSEERPFKCVLCDKGFKHREAVKLHERKHSGKKPFLCAQCGAQFAIESSLRSHMVVHTEERPFECKECNARFKTPATLRMHKEVHTVGNTHLCAVCGEQFKTARALRSHTRRHGDKPHQCSECGNRFAILGELNRHLKITHSASKPHACEICGFCFKLKNYLSTHMARMHSGDRRPHKCVVCRASFKIPLDLKHHMRKHSDLRPFPCNLCDWKFKTKTHLKQHIDVIHGRGGRVKCFSRRTIRSADCSTRSKKTNTSVTTHQLNKESSQEIPNTSSINVSAAMHNISVTERIHPITIGTHVLQNLTEMDQTIQKGDLSLPSTHPTLDQSILPAPPLVQPSEQLSVDQVTPQSPMFRDTSWSDTLDTSLIQSAADLDLSMTRPRWPPFQSVPYMFQRQTYYNTNQTATGFIIGNSETL